MLQGVELKNLIQLTQNNDSTNYIITNLKQDTLLNFRFCCH